MQPVIKKNEPLHLQSYRLVKEAIVNGDYSPGTRITELELSKQLGVSRGTIRESIKMLLQDGLLTQKQSHLIVFESTLKVATDLYLCRERLESLAANLASINIKENEKEQLESTVVQTRKALEQNKRIEVSQLNTEFHEMIVKFSRNEELIKLMDVIRAKTLVIRNNIHRHYVRADKFIDEHEAIARAIINHDGKLAEENMAKHIQNDLTAVHKYFEK